MRNFALLLFMFSGFPVLHAQVIDPNETAKRKATDRANSRIDQGIDQGLDKVEEGIGSIFKKKEKNKKSSKEDTAAANSDTEKNNSNSSATGSESSSVAGVNISRSRFDFVPGSQVLYSTNFSNEAIGDFPVDFNTNASGEVVRVSGKEGKWFSLNKNGAFIPDGISHLPENFTLEFEIGIIGDPSNNYSGFGVNFTTVKEELMKDVLFGLGTSALWMHPAAEEAYIGVFPSSGDPFLENAIQMSQWNVTDKSFAKIAIWRQKGRIRLYVNQEKVVDVPRFFVETKPYQLAFFRRFFNECQVMITNIRFAVAGADTRSKLIDEGKFVTNEILFDVNSDVIKNESNAVLKEIGSVLKENTGIRIKIIGHTDSDGDDTANLILSKKRAESVKNKLVSDFGIDSVRLTTDGKGESQPVESNNTTLGKAKNRRVEFIKQ